MYQLPHTMCMCMAASPACTRPCARLFGALRCGWLAGWLQALREVVAPAWGDVHVAISGLTNTYSSYITTWEEYQQQR